jgi:hypothetical protein
MSDMIQEHYTNSHEDLCLWMDIKMCGRLVKKLQPIVWSAFIHSIL